MSRTLLLSVMSTVYLLAAPRPPTSFQRPLVFEPNSGQFPEQVKWIARGPDYQLLFTSEGASFKLFEDASEPRPSLPSAPGSRPELPSGALRKPSYSTVQMKLTGGRPWAAIKGLEPTGGITNYLLGGQSRNWKTGVQHYSRLSIAGVYEGIDLVFYSNGSQLEYDFVVAPGADPKRIRLAFDGVERMQVDSKSGDLLLTMRSGAELRHFRPKVYQQAGARKVEVAGGYEILDRRQATFTLAAYDPGRPLIIDPEIAYLKNLKGWKPNDFYDKATDVAVDSFGNAWVIGYSSSEYLSIETIKGNNSGDGAAAGRSCRDHREDSRPNFDVFVTKVAPDGALLWIDFIGGCQRDEGNSIAVDSTGAYITGYTESTHFPLVNPFQTLVGGGAFVTKLDPNGTILYSTHLGTPGGIGNAIAVDSSHNAYVVGITVNGFPTVGPMQPNFGGVTDGFVAKMNPMGSGLVYSTYLGGAGFDHANGVAVDSAGHAYVTGVTGSPNFPTFAANQSYPEGPSAFVTKLSPQGNAPVYSTYLGGGDDRGKEIEVDAAGNAYVTGETNSRTFPTTAGAFQVSKPSSGGLVSAFLTKLSSTGALLLSTYFSGTDGETHGRDIAVNSFGEIYVCGLSTATLLPGGGPWQGHGIGFITKLSPQLNALQYTILYGADVSGIALSGSSNPVVYNHTVVHAAGRSPQAMGS